MTYEVVFEIKITQGGLMVKKSSYFKIVFEGDIYYFHNDKLAIWFHHSSGLRCIKQFEQDIQFIFSIIAKTVSIILGIIGEI